MMIKTVGIFEGKIYGEGYPIRCFIKDDRSGEIIFNHRDLPDLEHLVKEIRRSVKNNLPEDRKEEV